MMPVTKTYVTGGEKDPINLDYLPTSQITAAVSLVAGADAYEVQVTLDNVFDPDADDYMTPATARWFPVILFPTTGNAYLTFDGPWRAIRIDITALTAPVTFQVGQSTTPRL